MAAASKLALGDLSLLPERSQRVDALMHLPPLSGDLTLPRARRLGGEPEVDLVVQATTFCRQARFVGFQGR
jgi:hypothetical protein